MVSLPNLFRVSRDAIDPFCGFGGYLLSTIAATVKFNPHQPTRGDRNEDRDQNVTSIHRSLLRVLLELWWTLHIAADSAVTVHSSSPKINSTLVAPTMLITGHKH
jgi:hypothetical protein